MTNRLVSSLGSMVINPLVTGGELGVGNTDVVVLASPLPACSLVPVDVVGIGVRADVPVIASDSSDPLSSTPLSEGFTCNVV